jgi:hypothetical protein
MMRLAISALALWLTLAPGAANPVFPGKDWERIQRPESVGYSCQWLFPGRSHHA